MGILIQPKRWTMKPPIGTQINWGHPLANGLVGCWLMNEAAGQRLTDCLSRNNGTVISTWTTCPLGTALTFDGSSKYVDFGSNATFALAGALTIQAFINVSVLSTTGIFTNSDGDAISLMWALEIQNSGKISTLQGNNPYDRPTGNTILSTNTWYRVGVTRSGTNGNWNLALYVNGRSDGTAAGTATLPTNQLTSLGRYGSVLYFNGLIGDAMLWGRALSASEIQWLYAEPYAFMQPMTRRTWSKSIVAGGGLFRPTSDGLGAGGPFFSNPIG